MSDSSPMPLILDVDTGVDDALALLYAAATPTVELVGATAIMGNVTVDTALTNTLAVLELVGLAHVEVARGASRPLVRDHEPFPVVHGEQGLGDAVLPAPSAAASSRSAAELIVETARARPGEVLLVATGPLTNVAVALTLEPDLPDLLRGFAIMGGSYARGGNATPAAEANTWVDPDAAQAVFRGFSGRDGAKLPRCVGLDVTEQVRLSRAISRRSGASARFARRADSCAIRFRSTSSSMSDAATTEVHACTIRSPSRSPSTPRWPVGPRPAWKWRLTACGPVA